MGQEGCGSPRDTAKLARARNESESQVLPDALDLLHQRQRRDEAIHGLIRMAEEETKPYQKVRFRLK